MPRLIFICLILCIGHMQYLFITSTFRLATHTQVSRTPCKGYTGVVQGSSTVFAIRTGTHSVPQPDGYLTATRQLPYRCQRTMRRKLCVVPSSNCSWSTYTPVRCGIRSMAPSVTAVCISFTPKALYSKALPLASVFTVTASPGATILGETDTAVPADLSTAFFSHDRTVRPSVVVSNTEYVSSGDKGVSE